MKKYFSILVMVICLLSSCSNEYVETKPVVQTTTSEYADLKVGICELNDSCRNTLTRGFWGRLFNRVVKIFVSDCIGTIKGAITGDNIWQSAQGASVTSASKQGGVTLLDVTNTYITRSSNAGDSMKVTQVLQPKSVALENLILVDSSATATINDSIGYYHNTIIYSTFEKKDNINYWKSVSDYTRVLELNKEIINTVPSTSYNDTILNIETVNFCKFIGEKSLACKDYKELLHETSVQYPELKNMLEITSGFFEGMELVSTEEEWEKYCKDVIKLITNSKIPEKDKSALKMGICVGYASSKLWRVEE